MGLASNVSPPQLLPTTLDRLGLRRPKRPAFSCSLESRAQPMIVNAFEMPLERGPALRILICNNGIANLRARSNEERERRSAGTRTPAINLPSHFQGAHSIGVLARHREA